MEKERRPIEVKPKIIDSDLSLRKPLSQPNSAPRESSTRTSPLVRTRSALVEPRFQGGSATSITHSVSTSLLKLSLALVATLSGALTTAILVTIHFPDALSLTLPMALVCIVEALNIVLLVMLWMVAPREH